MFIGTSFAGSPACINLTPMRHFPVTTLTFEQMILDEMYATKEMLLKFNWQIPTDWSFDTLLHAVFQNNTMAGNIAYSEFVAQKIKIKKRYAGEFDWKTIYEKDIHVNEDFEIEFYDYYNPAKREIEYAYVPVILGADANPISTSVYSDFDSYFICSRDGSYPMILDTDTSMQLNRSTSLVNTIGSKYPFVVNNGTINYYSGTLDVTFIELKDSGFNVERGWEYRRTIDKYLSDGRAKIIKNFEGDMWMVNIIDNIPRTANGHYQNVSHSINWVECGDPDNISDLYDNGFIDTNTDE